MQNISEASAAAAAEQIIQRLSRLTVLRPLLEEPPFAALYRYASALAAGDMPGVAFAYHALAAALTAGCYREVTGDIFEDYLLYALLERENAFSRRALCNRWNDAVSAAMASDLEQLQGLSRVNSALLKKWAGERREQIQAKGRSAAQKQDDIAMLSAAVWSGAAAEKKPLPKRAPEPAKPLPSDHAAGWGEKDWPTFRYAIQALQGEYVSDIALEEMYRRLLESRDWSRLLDDIWNFHAAYGTGVFIKHRAFTLMADGTLTGVTPQPLFDDGPRLYEPQRNRLLAAAIRFMQGETGQDTLLIGGAGTGKTAGVLDIYYELPELRLLLASDASPEALERAVAHIAEQPVRVLLLLDDCAPEHTRFSQQMSAIARYRGENLMVVAAARAGAAPSFPHTVLFPEMQPREFMQLLRRMLNSAGISATEDMLQNACIDCASQKRSLCYATAAAAAREISEKE